MDDAHIIAAVRQAAQSRIRFFQEALAEHELIARVGMELEFTPLNKAGVMQADLLNAKQMTTHLQETVPGVEKIYREINSNNTQYELVTGPNAKLNAGLADVSPLAAAETTAAFKDALTRYIPKWGLGDVSFQARMKNGTALQNNGLHVNLSLWGQDGGANLFYEKGKATTDLQRHVIDALIEQHRTAGLIYLPNANSYERVAVNQEIDIANPQAVQDLVSGIPNCVGYLDNKGSTNTVSMIRDLASRGYTPIGSVSSRYRNSNLFNRLMGLSERVVASEGRITPIGWEKPSQYRIESRLAGADADPYVVVASELAAVHDAVAKHVRPFDPGASLDSAREVLIRAGEKLLVVDKHPGMFHFAPLPRNIDESYVQFIHNDQNRHRLGDDLFHAVAHLYRPTGITPKVGELAASSETHVQRYLKEKGVTPSATIITSTMDAAFNSMPSPALQKDEAQKNWFKRMLQREAPGNYQGPAM